MNVINFYNYGWYYCDFVRFLFPIKSYVYFDENFNKVYDLIIKELIENIRGQIIFNIKYNDKKNPIWVLFLYEKQI
jgi:hypothetical protein